MCALEDEADGLVLSELLTSFPHLSFPGRVAGRLNGLKKWATEVQKWGGGFGGEIGYRTRIKATGGRGEGVKQ